MTAARTLKYILPGVLGLLKLGSAYYVSSAQPLPGTLRYSWVGNTLMDHNARAWVPDEVRDLCVAPDGTVFTAGCAEAGGSGLGIKNGVFFGRYSGFKLGFGDPVKAVLTCRRICRKRGDLAKQKSSSS